MDDYMELARVILPALAIDSRIAPQILRQREEKYTGLCPHFRQVSRDHKTITAIVSLPAKHDNSPPRQIRISLLDEQCDAPSGILHQGEAWNAKALRR